ncbi:NAD(P)-dependent dehydrogenase (short-subunit alcohol dehydrogenase family) [Idiomarina aquatica]|uniref:NAD(P)-dependent dehydrogenase (Short-subunit alcohol dehydrogenase family) n=1 Tax=Idiomarina aquatica TaxID=1327752 RepID=A0A4R6PPD1_9GAMM|nr:SDR family oxidoreductase [Idiomarina aquatica]TDP40215.1 NAD(P)-dependent dehydrogenase (short-subunit alcohol dehydrogenase family) [Idiomarina aquatica]
MTKNEQKFALITGANGGIGQALCKTFTEEGYEVIATDVHEQPTESLIFSRYVSIDLNKLVESESYATDRTNEIKSLLPNRELHALINNAAIQILGGVDSLTRADWNQTLNVNLQAPFFLVQTLKNELEACRGSIVNISSIHAKLTKRNFVAYATSKSALSGMTKAMSVDLGAKVKVNGVAPAAIETEMLISGFSENREGLAKLNDYHPTGTIGEPREVATTALFLANSNTRFLNGEILEINGGIGNCLHDPD